MFVENDIIPNNLTEEEEKKLVEFKNSENYEEIKSIEILKKKLIKRKKLIMKINKKKSII